MKITTALTSPTTGWGPIAGFLRGKDEGSVAPDHRLYGLGDFM